MTDDDEGVLSPDDLELPDEHVAELDDERLVVYPDGEPSGRPEGASLPDPVAGDERDDGANDERDDGARGGAGQRSLRDAADVPEAYALAAAAKTERGLDERVVRSNDVGRTFELFLRWYAGRVAPDRDVEEVLRVLVAASDLDATVERQR